MPRPDDFSKYNDNQSKKSTDVESLFTSSDTAPLGVTPRLYEQIYNIIAQQIRNGERPRGERLGESNVAAKFGVSRAPVRQALAELERDGLIKKADGRGYQVSGGKTKTRHARVADTGADEQDLRLVSSVSWERIYAQIECELAARTSFGAWQLNEAKLARHFQVSRSVTRDVVGRLQQKGLLRKDDRSRWYVPLVTPDYVLELYELRMLLEPVALTKAAAQAPDGFFSRMRANLEKALQNPQDTDGGVLDRLETEMHVTLLGRCGSKTLMQAVALPQSMLITHRFLYKWTGRTFSIEPIFLEHLEIVGNLEKGRVEKAAELLRVHLLASQHRTIERMRLLNGKFSPSNLPYLTLLSQV